MQSEQTITISTDDLDQAAYNSFQARERARKGLRNICDSLYERACIMLENATPEVQERAASKANISIVTERADDRLTFAGTLSFTADLKTKETP